jgi:cell wall-associated NlpC family hydrolase
MTTARTSLARRSLRSGRGALIALVAGTGVALTPLPALANTSTAGPAVAAAPAAAPNQVAQTAVDTALAQQGKPYAWGGAGPSSFDCSGLVQYAYAAAGVSLPHSSSMQSTLGTPVSLADLQPGDLVFFYSPVSHVAMYIGNGQIVHASTAGQPVKVVSLDSMSAYINSARRIA